MECPVSTVIEMKCPKCEQHFCLSHRFHDCNSVMLKNDHDIWKKHKENFKVVKAKTDSQVCLFLLLFNVIGQ